MEPQNLIIYNTNLAKQEADKILLQGDKTHEKLETQKIEQEKHKEPNKFKKFVKKAWKFIKHPENTL